MLRVALWLAGVIPFDVGVALLGIWIYDHSPYDRWDVGVYALIAVLAAALFLPWWWDMLGHWLHESDDASQ